MTAADDLPVQRMDDAGADAPHTRQRNPPGRVTYIAAAFALGIVVQTRLPSVSVMFWLTAGSAMLIVSATTGRRLSNRARFACLCAATVPAGAACAMLHLQYRASHDLAALVPSDAASLITVEGTALTDPQPTAPPRGSFGDFSYRTPSYHMTIEVEAIIEPDGSKRTISGKVRALIQETIESIQPGTKVRATGFLLSPRQPLNPGEFDAAEYSRSQGIAGHILVPTRNLLQELSPPGGLINTLRSWRAMLRTEVHSLLIADLPKERMHGRNALLEALLLGSRGEAYGEVNDSFQILGLSHLLAISGLHLGILAGFVLIVVRFFSQSRAMQGLVVLLMVSTYLVIVEPRVPVLRAGIMTLIGCLGMITGRRLNVSGLIALSAVLLLMWQPNELFSAGFQLSYGVVLGIIHLSPHVRARYFGLPNSVAASSLQMIGQWLRTSTAVSLTAWAVATPITCYHFGSISLLVVPLTTLTLPIFTLLLVLSMMKVLIALLLPTVAFGLGIALSVLAEGLLRFTDWVDDFSLASISVMPPSTWWVIAALAWAVWWGLRKQFDRHMLLWPALGVLTGLLYLPPIVQPQSPLRVDMLAVGDGSCIIVRSGRSTVVFDAGSTSNLNAGKRIVIPAMRRMGITRIDAIFISHANLDHFSAVPELIDEFNVPAVYLTRPFVERAQASPDTAPAHLMRELDRRSVRVIQSVAGDSYRFGKSSWSLLQPARDGSEIEPNDESMVMLIEAGARSALLCGDVQEHAMHALLEAHPDLRADILELPHHGSFHPMAALFVRRVQPRVVMQSTGWRRWERDQWQASLAEGDAARLVTARDGAIFVELKPDGSLHTGSCHPHTTAALTRSIIY